MKAELKSLPAGIADIVAAHLWAAGELIDDDPELAYRHAEAARRRAARLPIAREASAEAAYAAGLYEQALTQYRALRRMTGSDDYLPVMADSLRALGRYRDALDLVAEGERAHLDPAMAVELLIVQAGIRQDMGQRDEAMRLLRTELDRPRLRHPRLAQARLLYAYADLLDQSGDQAGAYRGFAAAASLDPDQTTSALERLDEMDGVTMDIDPTEFEASPAETTSPAEAADGAEDEVEVGAVNTVDRSDADSDADEADGAVPVAGDQAATGSGEAADGVREGEAGEAGASL